MTNSKKYYRTTYAVVVLSEEPIDPNTGLDEVMRECDYGAYVGRCTTVSTEELDGKQMAAALREQASEPGFFDLDDEGNDTNDDDEQG